jgi:hypothetical protein
METLTLFRFPCSPLVDLISKGSQAQAQAAARSIFLTDEPFPSASQAKQAKARVARRRFILLLVL